jgi:hypothetical protein
MNYQLQRTVRKITIWIDKGKSKILNTGNSTKSQAGEVTTHVTHQLQGTMQNKIVIGID